MKCIYFLWAIIYLGNNAFADAKYISQYVLLDINGRYNLYCVDYKIKNDDKYYFPEILDLIKVEENYKLPNSAIEYLKNILIHHHYHFPKKDTVNFRENRDVVYLIENIDCNADGVGDLQLYDPEVSGRNSIYHAFVSLKGRLVEWHNYPSPVWDIDLETRKITGGWNYGASTIVSETYQIFDDTSIQLVHFWETYLNGNDALIREDSILVNDLWQVKIDSNFVFN